MKFNDLAVRGIDISGYNGAIDWAKVKAHSHFVIIRAGYGNTTDKTFLANWKNASVPKAAYWYMDYYSNWYNKESKAYGLSDATFGILQANNCWDLLKGDPGGSIVWLDIESGGADYSPSITTSPAAGHAQAIAKAFLMEMDRLNGRKNGIYCSVGLLTWFDKWFRDRPLWVAWYTKTQTVDSVLKAVRDKGWKGEVLLWQYASDGDLDGNGTKDGKTMGMQYDFLDLNVWLGTVKEYQEWTGEKMLLNIEPLSQRDKKWKDNKLGHTDTTIGEYGCLITCASMMLRHFGIDTDPARLNDWLKANGGYYNGNLFVWNSLNKLDKRVSFGYRYQPVPLDKIDEQLRAGKPVIANVDMNPATPALDEHWVLIVGKDGDYLINDPWTGTRFKAKEKYPEFRIICTYNFEEVAVMYRVRVTIDNLLIRAGAGATYAIVERYAKGEYDVFEEKNGYGRIGKDRWIALAYTEKVSNTGVPTGEPSDAEKLRILWDWYKGNR